MEQSLLLYYYLLIIVFVICITTVNPPLCVLSTKRMLWFSEDLCARPSSASCWSWDVGWLLCSEPVCHLSFGGIVATASLSGLSEAQIRRRWECESPLNHSKSVWDTILCILAADLGFLYSVGLSWNYSQDSSSGIGNFHRNWISSW